MKKNIFRYALAIITTSTILLVGGGCQETLDPQVNLIENADAFIKKQLTVEEILIVDKLKETKSLFFKLLTE